MNLLIKNLSRDDLLHIEYYIESLNIDCEYIRVPNDQGVKGGDSPPYSKRRPDLTGPQPFGSINVYTASRGPTCIKKAQALPPRLILHNTYSLKLSLISPQLTRHIKLCRKRSFNIGVLSRLSSARSSIASLTMSTFSSRVYRLLVNTPSAQLYMDSSELSHRLIIHVSLFAQPQYLSISFLPVGRQSLLNLQFFISVYFAE